MLVDDMSSPAQRRLRTCSGGEDFRVLSTVYSSASGCYSETGSETDAYVNADSDRIVFPAHLTASSSGNEVVSSPPTFEGLSCCPGDLLRSPLCNSHAKTWTIQSDDRTSAHSAEQSDGRTLRDWASVCFWCGSELTLQNAVRHGRNTILLSCCWTGRPRCSCAVDKTTKSG